MARRIALCISDIHLNDWKKFNERDRRIYTTINLLHKLGAQAAEEGIPVLIPGDLFHTPKGLTTKLLQITTALFRSMSDMGARFILTSGNHDIDGDYSLVKALENAFPDTIKCIDNSYENIRGFSDDYRVYGIPYRKRNEGVVDQIKEFGKMSGKKILMLHTPLYGALDPNGYELEPQNFPRQLLALFKDFDLVLSGHIHKFTAVEKNIIMVGAPNQQRVSDAGCDMGYLEIYDDGKNLSYEFMEVDMPKFRYYHEGEEPENDYDFWTMIPKVKSVGKSEDVRITAKMAKEKMVKRYAKAKGIKSSKKIKILTELLHQADD